MILRKKATTIIRCSELDKHLEFDGGLIVAIVITVFLRKVLIYLHEFIHAIFYPKEVEKTIWKDLKQEAYAIHHSGKWYTNGNIDQMLMERHMNKKARRASHKNHMRGPKKRTDEDDERFRQSLGKENSKGVVEWDT